MWAHTILWQDMPQIVLLRKEPNKKILELNTYLSRLAIYFQLQKIFIQFQLFSATNWTYARNPTFVVILFIVLVAVGILIWWLHQKICICLEITYLLLLCVFIYVYLNLRGVVLKSLKVHGSVNNLMGKLFEIHKLISILHLDNSMSVHFFACNNSNQ